MHMLLMCRCVEPARKTTTKRAESVLVHSKTDTLLISMYAKMFPLMATAERAHVYIPFHVEKYGRVHSLRTRVLIIRFGRASEITECHAAPSSMCRDRVLEPERTPAMAKCFFSFLENSRPLVSATEASPNE